MKRSPEALFDYITQDHEVLQIFKHHSVRVMYLATLLGKKIEHYDEDLRVAALLHDIGKIGIAKEILLKPARLTLLEKTIVESHSHIGNVIVRKELGKTRAAEFIRDHHEDWDGRGYPRRLIGEQISIQGRIIRICDAFDTMTYDLRNYNAVKKSHEEAFAELERCAWTQFDGNLVDTFISLIKEVELPNRWYDTFDVEVFKRTFPQVENPYHFF
ncbi:HD-GYP domain-containing protein [Salsuginibacillus kocurii]|uniref:HD-GYP domain-containing protein n=1 Tax=Salsuginibacillus kocurii TaxID=427078 RepID=UPI000364FA32|nr:HD domain-containing phosphohydrolase [Salsuginibacillus kocurii]